MPKRTMATTPWQTAAMPRTIRTPRGLLPWTTDVQVRTDSGVAVVGSDPCRAAQRVGPSAILQRGAGQQTPRQHASLAPVDQQLPLAAADLPPQDGRAHRGE